MYSELFGKRLLVIGGNPWAESIKSFTKENGIVLIAAGNRPDSKLFQIADESYVEDSTDIDAMKQLITEKHIDGVYMGASEPVIAAASEYINDLGLPCYCTPKQWRILQNKLCFKELCIQNELPVVPSYNLENGIESAVPLNEYPVVIKPADGCGSRGFSVCHNLNELKKGREAALNESTSGCVIVEKLVPNNSVGVFYTVSRGKILFSGLEDKYSVHFEKQGSYIGGLFTFESNLVDDFRVRFEKKIERMIHSIGIQEGSFWIEVFHNNDKYYFNEVGFRYGGSYSIFPVDYFYGINQVAADIYYALTGKSKTEGFTSLIPKSVPRKRNYAIYPIICGAGYIKKIEGIDDVINMDSIVTFPIVHSEGEYIFDSGSFSQIVALAHFVFDTEEDLMNTIDEIHNRMKYLDENDNNLIIRMLDLSNLRLQKQ